MMKLRLLPLAFAAVALGAFFQLPVFGRLGENEAQSKSRYGDPVEGLVGADEKPLMPGAKELAYNFESWRVRAAFVNGVTQRIQYVKIAGGKPVAPTEAEMEALLEAEKGAYKWREDKPRTGFDSLNKLSEALGGRKWERSDHADAILLLNIVMQFQSRDAEKIEKQLAKTKTTPKPGGKGATPAPNVPKF